MIKQIIVLLGGRKFLQQSKSGDMTPPKHPEELLPAKHPPHLHALQAHEKHPYEADVPKLGTPAPATCLTRTHRRCLRGGCFAGREDYHEEASPLTAPCLPCLVENVLPKGKITTRRHLRSPLPCLPYSVADVFPEGKSAPQKSLRQSDISTGTSVPVGKVPRGATPAAEGTRFIVKGQRTAT